MQLIRCRVAGHFILQNSDWFTVHETRTTITGPAGSGKSTLLKAMRSINPPSCQPIQAPFADFPRYVSSGQYTRRVIPAKKTAVIGVFICDNPLRDKLSAIDPDFMKTDRIEVGRRLDNSQWVTYVEIAASSRWSELAPELAELRRRFPDSADDRVLGPLWRQCETPAATDRIKGPLASRCNELLDQLAARATDEEDRALVRQAGFIVNRDARFAAARQATRQALPVFVYLQEDELLSATIDVGRIAGKMRQEEKSPCSCADLFFLELLGFDQFFLRQASAEQIALRLQEDDVRLAPAGRLLGERLRKYLPDSGPHLSLTLTAGAITLHMGSGQANNLGPPVIAGHWRWMLSCAVSAWYISEVQGRRPILLLDEPDASLGNREEKIELEAMLRRLSGSCQLVVCPAGEDFLADSGKRYQLRQEGENGYRVSK